MRQGEEKKEGEKGDENKGERERERNDTLPLYLKSILEVRFYVRSLN